MLSKILLATINGSSHACNAMQMDDFENPKTYSGWFYPVRYLLSLRYLKIKQSVLADFRQDKIYPISDNDFKKAIIRQLKGKKSTQIKSFDDDKTIQQRTPLLASLFKVKFVYPLLFLVLAIGAYQSHQFNQAKKIENVLANYLPYYSDLLHRRLLLTHNQGNKESIAVIDDKINTTGEKILSDLPEKNGIRSSMQAQLLKLKDTELDSEQIMLGFKSLNTLFDQQQQPFYLTPKSFSIPCSSLIDAPLEQMMMLKQLESLMSNNNPERCRTTMMTTYKVGDRTQLYLEPENDTSTKKSTDKNIELPLFHVRRIDKVPAADGALGLTFKDRGIGSIILTDRVKNFAEESVLPALSFQGRSYIIPYWMQGHYEIEEVVTKAYKKDIAQIYPNKKEQHQVKALIKGLIKDKARMQNSKMAQTMQRTNSNNDQSLFGNGLDAISVLLGKTNKEKKGFSKSNRPTNLVFTKEEKRLLSKLETALYPSIEYHEAYHQIDKKRWKPPSWLEPTFKGKLNVNSTEHALEELGAYLFQLANTDQVQNVWLSKLLIFSLNPMTKGQAEYYASSIIFNAFDSLDKNGVIDVSYTATVDDKARIFKKLLTLNAKEINLFSKYIYEKIFERKIPLFSGE